MKDNLQAQLLMELAKQDLPWRCTSSFDFDNISVGWLPVAELSGGRILLALTSEGSWARVTGSMVHETSASQSDVFFLPILEEPFHAVRSKLSRGLECYGLPRGFIETLPIEKIVLAGLKSQSEYWSSLALNWVSFIDHSDELKGVLTQLIAIGETQKIRHTARKFIFNKTRKRNPE